MQTSARTAPYARIASLPVSSGPGFHIADLRVSGDFWDEDLAVIEETEEEFEAELAALVHVLSRRWGEPELLDLTGHLERSFRDEPIPPPLDALCGHVTELYVWRIGGRMVGLGLGMGDRELPIQLLAAIGEGDAR